jgi:hypothetical protein
VRRPQGSWGNFIGCSAFDIRGSQVHGEGKENVTNSQASKIHPFISIRKFILAITLGDFVPVSLRRAERRTAVSPVIPSW